MAKKILIADDDYRLVFLIKTRLESKGYTVFSAKDGEEALMKARQTSPDLILIDVQMPKMDGDEVYMTLKSDPATLKIPIFFLTGLRSEEEIEETKEDGVFAKPVDFEKLFAKIRETLGE